MAGCIFCSIARGEVKAWKVYEDDSVLAFLDIHPVSEYHTLVIPKTHYENIYYIPEKELLEVMAVVRQLTHLYRSKLGINNVQVITTSGSAAQQDIFHFHVHIIPRETGDRQDLVWHTHPEWVERFDELLERLK